jgi:hypothetical protein
VSPTEFEDAVRDLQHADNGSLGLAQPEMRNAPFQVHKATIMFSRSTNGGRSWSSPVAINARQDVHAFTPAITVAPNGVVPVT